MAALFLRLVALRSLGLRLLGLRLIGGVILSVTLNAAAADKVENSKAELSSIQERIATLKQQLESATEAHADVTDALKKSEKAISETNRTLYNLNLQRQDNQNKLQDLQSQKSDLEITVDSQKKLLANQLYQQYMHGQQSYVQIFLQQQSPAEIARNVHYYSYISQARAKLIDAMQGNLDKVARLNQDTAKTLSALNELKVVQEQERKNLQKQKDERAKTLQKLVAQISAQRSEIEKLKRDEKNLSDLVERLTREAANKAANLAKKRKKPSGDNTATDNNDTGKSLLRNDDVPNNAFDGSQFAALRGKLKLPVKGDIINRFGTQREDTGISWKGIFIRAAAGSEVKAIASGMVVFSDWMRGFGNLMIIDHGDGYMSLYGNNEALLRKTGETVKGGDTIASVGNTGGNDSTGLYYELRKQSKPFDPLSWSSVK